MTSQPTEIRDLDRSAVRGIAWTGAAKWGTQLLSWLSTLVVARILTPADYGVAGMAMVYVGLVQLVNEFGLGPAVVQGRDLSPRQLASLNTVSVGLGAAFCAVSIGLSGPVARFFAEDAIGSAVLVLSSTFLVSGFQVLPRAILTRDMRFRSLALADALEAIVRTATALTLALLGFRYWALVLAGVTGRIASTITLSALGPCPFARPGPWRSIAAPLKFGWHVVAASLAWYIYSNADVTVVGRRLGAASLGAYTLAWSLASVPLERVVELFGRVAPALFSAVQNQREALQRYVLRLTEIVSLVTFPAAAGLALVAPDVVAVVLGPRWEAAVGPLRLLALAAGLRSVGPLLNQVLVAKGRPDLTMWTTAWTAAILAPLFYVGSWWGTIGVAGVWVVGYPCTLFGLTARYTLASSGITMRSYLGALWPAARASAVMAGVVLLVTSQVDRGPGLVRLAVTVGAGILSYAACLLLLNRTELVTYAQWFRSTMKQRPPSPNAATVPEHAAESMISPHGDSSAVDPVAKGDCDGCEPEPGAAGSAAGLRGTGGDRQDK